MNKVEKSEGKGWKLVKLGSFKDMADKKGQSARGKFYLAPLLHIEQLDASVNSLKPGWINPFLHRHRSQVELYIFIKGKGEMKLGDKIVSVEEGDAVFVEPEIERGVRNNHDTELQFICIRAAGDSRITSPEEDGIPVKEKGWTPEQLL